MSAVDEELEEGEISDSDSMEEGEPKPNGKTVATAEVKQYSIFGSNLKPSHTFQPITRPPNSDSDPSSSEPSDDDSDDGRWAKKTRFHGHGNNTDSKQTKFVNPNFVKNGGVMPPLPTPSNRSLWGSVLQEQILTSEVGGFTVKQKVESDRDVESYDYTRAAEDDRPILSDSEAPSKEDELFGEVIDFDQTAASLKHGQSRKRARDRLGERRPMRDKKDRRLHVTETSSVEEVVYYVSKQLQESKVHLIRRVVQEVGRAKSLELLRLTEETEAAGGMMTMNGARRRTPGGVFLQLLKTDPEVRKEQHDKIFEEENRWFQEQKKRKRAKARQRRRQLQEQQQGQKRPQTSTSDAKEDGAPAGETTQSSAMDAEDPSSRTDAQPQNATEGATGGVEDSSNNEGELSDSDKSEAGSYEGHDSDSRESFATELQEELRRQAKERTERSEAIGVCDVDVLQIEVEDDDILD